MPDTPAREVEQRLLGFGYVVVREEDWRYLNERVAHLDALTDCGRLCIHVDDCPVHGVETREPNDA